MQAYHATHCPRSTIKLDAMENTHTTPQALQQLWQNSVPDLALNRYPDSNQDILKAALSSYLQLSAKQLLLGNGSDELIQLLMLACCENDSTVMTFDPSFVMYQHSATFCRIPCHRVPLTAQFDIDISATLQAIEQHQPRLIFIAYPNNPTGNLWSDAHLKRIIEASTGLVIIDEAYYDFARTSLISWQQKYPHLIVIRTFSKLGLAGLRLGYMIAQEQWIEQINKVRMPYNINSVTQQWVTLFLSQPHLLTTQSDYIINERNAISQQLADIPYIEQVFPSAANFILTKVATTSANKVCQHLLDNQILIKNFHGTHPTLDNCIRISIGTTDENESLMTALKTY